MARPRGRDRRRPAATGEILVRSGIGGGQGGAGGAGGTGGDGAGSAIGQNCPPVLPCFTWGMDGGDGYYGGSGGYGGDGGTGVYAAGTGPIIVQNQGTIRGGKNGGDGGKGGAAGTAGAAGYGSHNDIPPKDGSAGRAGRGGRGISGGGGVRVVAAGRIEGGLNADGSHSDAINLSGGGNTLELHAGYHVLGNVVLVRNDGNPNTLILGGWQNASFDFATLGGATQGFGAFEKDGASTWTLAGTTGFRTIRVGSGELVLSGTVRLTSASTSIDAEAGSNAAVTT